MTVTRRSAAVSFGLVLLITHLGLSAPVAGAAQTSGNWFLAPSLAQLQREVNARWPGRARSSDGWIGDRSHRKSPSDHNPVGHRNGPRHGTPGSVHGLDITASGIDTSVLLGAVIGDHRVAYVIFRSRIWSAWNGWVARNHPGSPHNTHIHVSLRADSPSGARAVEGDTGSWLSSGGAAGPSRGVGIRLGSSGPAVSSLQRALIRRGYRIPAGATGYFGAQTKQAVRKFQRRQGWSGGAADGIPGPTTMRRLGLSPGGAARPQRQKSKPQRSAPTRSPGTERYAPGSRGPHIAKMQRRLIRWGFGVKSGATGYFGRETRGAVRRFQRASGWHGRRANGIPGPSTLRRLGLS